MTNLKCLTGISVALFTLGYASIAQAADVTTSGTWSNVQISNPATLQGVGTNQISWGTPATGRGQSSYIFNGVNGALINLPAPGETSSLIALGTFTHNNFPIFPPSITGATLNLNLSINPSGDSSLFSFDFAHNETPNDQPGSICTTPPGFPEPCPDIVSFLNNGVSNETITIDGEEYNLIISGFRQTLDSPLVNEFITLENQANSAILFGFLGKPEDVGIVPDEVVPEPFTIVGVATALAFGTTFKKRLSKGK